MANLRVIAEIKPAGDFPVVDAPNVSVTGGKRLDVALSEAAAEVAKKANKSEVDTALASKANKSEVDATLAGKANKSEVDAAIENKADKSAFEAINASVSVNTSNIQELSTESTVLSARMDEFTKLEEGSTTGDAELIDGRIGSDGKTYDNIGGAIRGQVTDLKSDLSELGKYSIVNLGYATNETTEKDGITFTNNDGKNTLNGTATNNISFRLTQFTVTKDAQIKLSGFDGTHKTCIIWTQDIDTGEYSANCFGGQAIDVNLIAGHSYYLDIYITGGSRFDNYVLDTTIYFYRRTDALEMFPICLTSNNINTYLYDANKALPNTKYRISSRVIPQNMPPKMPNPLNCYIETQTTDVGNIQYIKDFATDKALWKRFNTGVWESVTHEVTVGLGYGDWDFSTLYEALLFAYSNENTHLTVYDGTYDIIEEMGADLTSESVGILLGKNMVVDFKPHAYVVCNYTGSDVGVKGIFSPFYVGMGNFEINNMKLSCSNVRYCVHDEKSDGADSYSHKYINCSFYIDNRNNTEGFPQCIGGGLGKNGHIEIVGCSFESETINPNGEKAEASYHNSSASGAKSEVIVKDNFFENGTFRISYYGASTEKTYAYVSNNRMKYAPYVSQENTSYNNVNVELRAWNNEIVN